MKGHQTSDLLSCLLNGEITDVIHVQDRGFGYGDGVFTTITVKDGCPLFFKSHLERLIRDSSRIGMPQPNIELLTSEVSFLVASHIDCVLKIILTRGPGRRGYYCPNPTPTRALLVYPQASRDILSFRPDAIVRLCETRLGRNSQLAGTKHLNRLEQVLARNEWCDDEINEGLMLDQEGHVTEGVASNIFIVKKGQLVTPRIEHCGVLGVMRNQVLSAADTLGISVIYQNIAVDDLMWADEFFITNCLVGVWGVKIFEGKLYNDFRLTESIHNRLAHMVVDEVLHWSKGKRA